MLNCCSSCVVETHPLFFFSLKEWEPALRQLPLSQVTISSTTPCTPIAQVEGINLPSL